jgi:hypothetical protein
MNDGTVPNIWVHELVPGFSNMAKMVLVDHEKQGVELCTMIGPYSEEHSPRARHITLSPPRRHIDDVDLFQKNRRLDMASVDRRRRTTVPVNASRFSVISYGSASTFSNFRLLF